ncbi:MAG: hypothetical protein EA396_02685 [Anaerolineaceae bacterium]|nr:MAG: hypothetical protein EA396_02685 [Anaerolineaceae bacterium]
MSALIDAVRKNLPPSASDLRLLDVNGAAADGLSAYRADLIAIPVDGDAATWQVEPASVDAVVALDYVLNDAFLSASLSVLRAGGRLIVANRRGDVREALGRRLEAAGYVRILVEAVPGGGLLMRGERQHDTADTLARIRHAAAQDADRLDLTTFKGRYVHLLIQQTPNKPAWHMTPDEPITWRALAIRRGEDQAVLAFSSLPKAVGFMQPAILSGHIKDVNKVGKFRRERAAQWPFKVLVNPHQDVLADAELTFITVDHRLAEAPDE